MNNEFYQEKNVRKVMNNEFYQRKKKDFKERPPSMDE
jgi:hypothetical protein